MAISRRQFFQRFTGARERSEQERRDRIAAIASYMRANLLPYDFTLNAGQTEQLFAEIQTRAATLDDEDMYSPRVRTMMDAISEVTIGPWRSAHWNAEDLRLTAMTYVREFLAQEATPENLQQLRHRFDIQHPAVVEEEVERQAQSWLNSLSDSRIREFDATSIRELVVSEMRSWC